MDSKWELQEKGIKTKMRREDTKAGEQRIVSSKGHGKGRATSQSNYCLSLSTNVFLSLLFLVVLVYLTPSCPLTIPCFRFVRVCVCASQQVTWSVIRVSGRVVTHWQSPPNTLTHSHTLDWATYRTRHGLTTVTAFPLKGLITVLHHIWNSK